MTYDNTYSKFRNFLHQFFYIGVGKSLLIWFLAISFIPLATVSFINYLNSYLGLTIIAEKALVTSSQLRLEYLNSYFDYKVAFITNEAEAEDNLVLLEKLKSNFNNEIKKNSQSATYIKLTGKLNHKLDNIAQKEGFNDYYLIGNNGLIYYSWRKKSDLGENLFTASLSGTLFGKTAWKSIKEGKLLFSDLEFYNPANEKISGFFIHPIINDNGDIAGAVAIRLNMDKVNNIIRHEADMGETGEAYLIGEDLMFRTPSRFEDEDVILKKKVINKKAISWLDYIKHQGDVEYLAINKLNIEDITTYANNRGNYVLGVYRTIYLLQDYGVNWALIEEFEHNEAFAYAQQLSDIAKISFLITVIIVFFISIFVTNWFVRPIKKISSWAKQVASGELVHKDIKAPKNEIGEMVDTFNILVKSLQSYANVSQLAALGDYSKPVEIRSEKDVLGKSMNKMVESFKGVVNQANKIAEGDYSAEIKPRGDKDTLGISLYEMTRRLRDSSTEIKNQDWLKTGINEIEAVLGGQENIKKLSEDIITFLANYLEANLGLFYLLEGDNLVLQSTFAFDIKDDEYKTLNIGEGIIGQAFKENKMLVMNNPKEKLPSLNLGFIKEVPEHFIISSFIFENQSLGVIMLGSISKFKDLHNLFFKNSLDSIAVAVNSVLSRQRVEGLLHRTQEQANELTVQQEELRQTNEELEEQTKALRLSEENLKHQQEELKVTNEELEVRTNDLEIQRDNIRKKNEELKQAQEEIEQKAKALEQASRYKSEFMANMSHELRTPMNSILVLSQLLSENKREHLDEKEIEFAKTIHSSGYDLLDLINEILDLSKVESGKLELHIEEMYFEDLNIFIKSTFKPLTDKKGLDLITEVQEDTPSHIRTDIQRVYQIIKNLFSNAIKFTEKGNIKLTVYKPDSNTNLEKSGLKPENAIAFAVSDTGIGIPKDKINLIFDAFKQADGTTSRKFGGTGLGLTISRSFSEILGGEISLESEVGKGTTFTLYLPESYDHEKIKPEFQYQQNNEVIPDRKTQKPAKKKQATTDLDFKDDKSSITAGDKFILVIEDDVNFCKVLYELAHEKGFKCMVALDGETGLHYADFYNPSAIILDIGLPGIDGYEVMERLKDNSKTRHIPVHFISAADKNLQAMKLGAIGYLTKPVSPKMLDDAFKKIENIISKPIKKVMVVEDDEIMRKSIVELLGDSSIAITAVESGKEAYELLQKGKFDCLILDLGLEEMSGYELLEKIRKNKKIVDLPIIIYTGKNLSKEDEAKLNKYADSIIIKGARSFERLLSETTLFLHQLESDMPETKREILHKLHSKENVLENRKILLVDDDMRNVFALSSFLEEKGLKIIVGKNGKEGIYKLEKNPDVDLILMDIMMPEMDGYEAMREIRKKKKYKDLPIIALTAKAMKEDREKCIAAGANDYLAKPVDTEKLLSLLRVWLYNK